MAQRHTARSAFTLIELLVVVAIIALLISILLPSLSEARQQGIRGKCLSNQRNLMTTTRTYFVDNNDYFPILCNNEGSGFCNFTFAGKSNDKWWKGGAFYLSAGARPLNRYMLNRVPEENAEIEGMKCPADKTNRQRDNGTVSNRSSYNEVGTSYLFNWAMIWDTNWNNNNPGPPWRSQWHPAPKDAPRIGIPNGFYRLGQKLVRETRAGAHSRLVWYYEEPIDIPLNFDKKATRGHHQKVNWFIVGHLDGSARYIKMDPREWCGPTYTAINPFWVKKDNPDKDLDVYYTPDSKNCDPKVK